MPLLFEEDYMSLQDHGIAYEESEHQRFFVFIGLVVQEGLYTKSSCDVLVVIPPNYNQAGNDMFWTFPQLIRSNGAAIPAAMGPGGGDNRVWNGKEFCRWSRHWNPPSDGVWRPGKDDIVSIFRRIDWALKNPDAK